MKKHIQFPKRKKIRHSNSIISKVQLKPRTKCHKFAADLVTFTEEIVNEKLHFLYSVTANVSQLSESPAANLNLLEEVIRNVDLQQQKSNIHRHKPSTKITSGL